MCFYVNLRELWPFASFFSRLGNYNNNNNKEKESITSDNESCGHKIRSDTRKTDVDGKFRSWNESEWAPHWLTSEAREESAHQKQPSLIREGDEIGASPCKTKQRHYGSNLLASLSSRAALELDAGSGQSGKGQSEASSLVDVTFSGESRDERTARRGQDAAQVRAMSDRQVPPMTGPNSDQDDIQNSNPAADTEVRQQNQQQPQPASQRGASDGHAGEPSQQALLEASKFRVRTARRRHLDFDDEFDLADCEAPQRSRWAGPFHFIQAADCQFGMIDSYVHHRTEPGWREEIELCERLVSLCHQMQPKPLFMIICGDLVDSLPASEIGRRQVVDFKRIFAKLDPTIPLVCVCGNHDVGDEPTSKTIADYRQTFGEDYFYFTKNDILFIVINSQFYQNRQHVQDEAREQDLWLEGLLARCRLFKYSIIFEHIPWFLEAAEEENDYFNIRKEVRLEWLRKFRDAGVTKIMCGHYHRNAGGWFEGMELVVTSAIGAQCGSDKSGIRIVKVLENSIEHQYYAMEDVPLRIEFGQ